MRRSGLSSALAVFAALPATSLPVPAQPPQLVCNNGKCERIIYGTAPAGSRLRVNAHGPVALEGGVGKDFRYTIRLSVNARSEAEARHALQHYAVRVSKQGPWTVLNAPGGVVMTDVTIKAPNLAA